MAFFDAFHGEFAGGRGGVTEVIAWPLGVMPLRVLEYVFDSNMGNEISPDIGNCQWAIPV